MRKSIYTLLLLLCCTAAMAQVAPAPPITQFNQNSVYIENITKDRYLFHGKDALGHPIWTRIPFVLSPNTVISGLGMSVSGSVLTVQPGYWRITNILFHTTTTTNFTLQPQDSVLSRYETVYADSANTLHIAVGSLSLNPVEPNIPSGDLRVGAALIQPLSATTPVIITQPGTITDYVFTHPKTKQSDAYPKVRSITADSIMTPFYILPTTAPHSGDVIQAAGDGTTFWSPQAIYNQGTGILISSNIVKADTLLLVTQRALIDTLKAHAAVFNPGQFTVINDTISLIGGVAHTIYTVSDSLTGNRVVKFVTHKLEFGDLVNNNAYVDIDPTNQSINLYTYGATNNSTFAIANDAFFLSNSNPGSGYSANFQVSGNDDSKAAAITAVGPGGSNRFQMYSSGVGVYTDGIGSKGIIYGNNYGANFTDRSLVDKGYVDSVAAATGGVHSVFGRTGAVVSATNDYTFAQIGSKPTTLSGYGITDAVPASRTITINGTALDLSANRSWTISGGLTSLTPGIGFLSHTPITASGTMDVDTTSTIATKANLGTTYFTESSSLYWAFGHSYPVGYPGITANSYPTLVSTALSKTGTNYGISGSGYPQQLSTYYFKEYSGTATADNQTNRAYITVDAGLNELKSKNLPLTKNGFKGYIETILAHHFTGGVILAADLTHTAGWTSVGSANTYVSKSGYLSAQTKSPLVSNTTTDSVTALNFRVQNGLVIGYLGGSPATQYGSVKVYVDNVLVSTISEQNQADSTTRVPVIQSGFTISNNNRVSKATVIWSVLPGYHKVVIKAATGGTNSTLDFIGTLDDPINCHVATVAHQNHLNATGYALFNTGLSNSDVDYFNASIDTAVAVFVNHGYPVNVMKIENYVTPADLGSDSVHLTTTGYSHMATGFEDSYASALKTRAKIANGVKYAIPVFSNTNTITFSSSLMSTDYKRFLFNGPTDDGNTPVQIQANGTSSSNSVLKVKDSGGALLEDFRENGDIFLKNSAQLNFFTNSYYIKAASGLQLNAGDFINFQVSGTTVGTIRPGGLVIGTSSPLTTSIFDAPSNSKGTTPFPRLPTSTRNSINGTILKIYIVSGGTSYATAPTLSFSSGSATATCTVSGGVINTVTITGAGSGYTPSTIPTITVTPTSGGSGAILIAAIADQGLHTYNTDNNTDNVYGQNGWSSVDASQGNDLTAQTSTGNIATFLVGTSTATFNVSAYLNVTAISTDVIQIQVTYTDENNTAQTISLANISAVGNSTYSPVTIRAKNATTITVKTNLSTGAGSVTFDAGARITQL